MLDPRNKELLQQLATSAHGKALKDFLNERYTAINDVTNCKNWEDAVGRQYALILLKEIFSFLEEKKTVDRTPSQYT